MSHKIIIFYFFLQTSPKKLIGQRSEGDVISLVGQSTAFADFAHFPGGEDEGIAEIDAMDGAPRRHGAFQVYRKHTSKLLQHTNSFFLSLVLFVNTLHQ